MQFWYISGLNSAKSMVKVKVQAPLLISKMHHHEDIKGIVERSASCNVVIFKTPGTTKLEKACEPFSVSNVTTLNLCNSQYNAIDLRYSCKGVFYNKVRPLL